MIDLSILVCSTHTRSTTFGRAIQGQLWPQWHALPEADRARVEIIMLTDNKQMMLGHKRNLMVDMAQGRYVQFVDDDDRIEPDMMASVLGAIDNWPGTDVITFLVSVRLNNGPARICRYSKDFKADANLVGPDGVVEYQRLPNHICAVRRELARQVSYPNVVYGEDAPYARLLHPLLQSETHIPRVLYHYDYNDATTEAQAQLPAPTRARAGEIPVADVVILSNAKTPALAALTQQTIDTCIAGANSLPINIIVMEQASRTAHQHATTIRARGPFNYNRFANIGIRQGKAALVVVANNDLIFRDNWLHALLLADKHVMSPRCPQDPRHHDLVADEAGWQVGRNLAGWCFAMGRGTWERLGGLDETYTFWCSDDVVVEQLQANNGPRPVVVYDSVVEHLGSQTLNQAPEYDELTWGQIHKWVQAHGSHPLACHQQYRDYCNRRANA